MDWVEGHFFVDYVSNGSFGCFSEVIYCVNFYCLFCRSSPDDWKFAAEELVKRFPDKVVVHCEHAMPFLLIITVV